jgi:FAD:protein FMN transferase
VTRVQRVEHVMGTVATIDVSVETDTDEVNDVLNSVVERLHDIDRRFSTYQTGSEVSRFGRGEIAASDLSDDLRTILDLSEKFNATTDGYFDIHAAAQTEPAASIQLSSNTASAPIEPSGVVKGWAIQQAADMLRMAGQHNFSVNLGGDVDAAGRPDEGENGGWRIGLQHPINGQQVMAVLKISDLAVATSGAYERGSHIISPQGEIQNPLLSVTIVGPDVVLADVYATAAFAMGSMGLGWATHLDGFEVFAVTLDQQTYRTPGLDLLLA